MVAYTTLVVYIEVVVVERVWTVDPLPGSDVGVTVIVMTGASNVGEYPGEE
jgi:hypothetical protein